MDGISFQRLERGTGTNITVRKMCLGVRKEMAVMNIRCCVPLITTTATTSAM